jgi:hypothetical protein
MGFPLKLFNLFLLCLNLSEMLFMKCEYFLGVALIVFPCSGALGLIAHLCMLLAFNPELALQLLQLYEAFQLYDLGYDFSSPQESTRCSIMHVPDEGIVYTQGFADPAQRAKGIA